MQLIAAGLPRGQNVPSAHAIGTMVAVGQWNPAHVAQAEQWCQRVMRCALAYTKRIIAIEGKYTRTCGAGAHALWPHLMLRLGPADQPRSAGERIVRVDGPRRQDRLRGTAGEDPSAIGCRLRRGAGRG